MEGWVTLRIIRHFRMRALVFLLLVAAASANVVDECSLVWALQAAGMDGFQGVPLGGWICVAKWESNYNTAATIRSRDRSTNYGIFQINARWCQGTGLKYKNGCNIPCNNLLLPDINDSITCAKHVVSRPRGIRAWPAWRNHCHAEDLSLYGNGCMV